MEDLLHTFEGFYKSSTAEELADKLKESGESGRRVLKLIKNVYEYISKAKNREVSQGEIVDSLLKKFIKPGNIKSHNFTVTLNTWAEYRTRINTEAYNVGKEIDKIVTDLYKAAGYTEL
jgi:response regulator of citrate/malate metabolism